MNSVAQGGLPVDVAETIAWLASPGVGRRQRPGRAGVRAEPAGSVRAVSEARLSGSPATLPMFARAGAGGGPRRDTAAVRGGGGGDVPDLALALDDVAVDRDRLAAYDRVCGFDVGDELPRDLSARAGVPASPVADDRRALPRDPDRAGAHRQPDHPAPPARGPASVCRCGCGRRRSSPIHGGGSSRCAPRSAWATSWCGRSTAPTSPAAPATRPPRPAPIAPGAGPGADRQLDAARRPRAPLWLGLG